MSTISTVTSTSTLTSLTPSSSSTLSSTETISSEGDSLSAQPKSSQSLSSGGITGIVIGTAAGIGIAGSVAYYFLRRRWIAKFENPNEPNSILDKALMDPHVNTNELASWQDNKPQELPQELPQDSSNTR
ncbi:hypothetical protein F5Y09DRAFT_339810 [Xylaria sp. FL1042]|nr:hypothetical protein F5Y09DRAFT_339810 [Xylaria sp. FL1042]